MIKISRSPQFFHKIKKILYVLRINKLKLVMTELNVFLKLLKEENTKSKIKSSKLSGIGYCLIKLC